MSGLASRPKSEWPADLRQTYDLHMALGDFWIAMEQLPIIKRIGPYRQYCGLKWTAAYARAVLAERDARELLALRDQARRHARG